MTKFDLFILIIVLALFSTVIFLNIILYRYIVSRALKKHIKPYFYNQGYCIKSYKYPGLFSSGAFKNKILFGIFIMGSPFINFYVDIYSKNNNGVLRKTTVQISTIFLFIHKLKYKDYENR